MTSSEPGGGDAQARPDHAYIEQLLARYPNISPREEQEILRFLRRAPVRERGLLNSNEAVRSKLAAFQIKHRATMSLQPRDWLKVAALIAFVAVLGFLLWGMGAV